MVIDDYVAARKIFISLVFNEPDPSGINNVTGTQNTCEGYRNFFNYIRLLQLPLPARWSGEVPRQLRPLRGCRVLIGSADSEQRCLYKLYIISKEKYLPTYHLWKFDQKRCSSRNPISEMKRKQISQLPQFHVRLHFTS